MGRDHEAWAAMSEARDDPLHLLAQSLQQMKSSMQSLHHYPREVVPSRRWRRRGRSTPLSGQLVVPKSSSLSVLGQLSLGLDHFTVTQLLLHTPPFQDLTARADGRLHVAICAEAETSPHVRGHGKTGA